MDQPSWFSDEPDPDSAGRFGRQEFLEKVVGTIRRARNAQTSTVFGLIGPWGIGKTSMLRWIGEAISTGSNTSPWTSVSFEPWAYQDLESLQLGFFSELATAFKGGGGKSPNVRDRLVRFANAVAPFASLTAPLGVSGTEAVRGFASLLEGDRSVSAERARLEQTLRDARTPILVVIDDVDRLSTDELLLTFKLVRLLGRLPYVHYLLSFDERTLLDVLSRTALVGEQTPSRARDYLEKVVQIRFDVPLLRESDAALLVDEGLAQLGATTGMSLTDAQMQRFASAYYEHLARHFTTPRTVRRFFAQVEAFAAQLEQEVDPIDFLLLAWIRTMYPGVYDQIQRSRLDLVDAPRRVRFEPDSEEYRNTRADFWRTVLERAGLDSDAADAVVSVLSELFPKFRATWQRKKYGGGRADALRIANDAYFDRYVLFGVPPDDIRDSIIRRAARDIAESEGGVDSDAVRHVAEVLSVSPGLVIEKLGRELYPLRPVSVSAHRWFAQMYGAIPQDRGILSPTRQFEVMIALQLRATARHNLDAALDALASADSPLLFLEALRRAMSSAAGLDQTSQPLTLEGDQRSRVSQRVQEHFGQAGVSPRTVHANLASAMWIWISIDEQGFKQWLLSAQPALNALEIACLLIGTSHALGIPNPPSRLNSLDLDLLGRFIDLQRLRTDFADEIASATAPDDTFFGWEDTPEERRRFVFWTLQGGVAE